MVDYYKIINGYVPLIVNNPFFEKKLIILGVSH